MGLNMDIEKITDTNINCFSCDKNRIDSVIQLKCCNVYICDECLQELNRKIVDYLADKNIQEEVV